MLSIMLSYVSANYKNNIYDNLIKLWERDCKKEEENQLKSFMEKSNGTWTTLPHKC